MTGPERILELFGEPTGLPRDWAAVVEAKRCPYLNTTCWKRRKSVATVIGTCTVGHGRNADPIMICPSRLLAGSLVFTDCLHLLQHEPGNELHVVPEVSLPGGSIDYFLVSARDRKVHDFVGIEFQTLDTTGTVWPARQRFLKFKGIEVDERDAANSESFGMNWKMTAKTTLVQLHHKIQTFEAVSKHLVLVIQDVLLDYFRAQFAFDHVGAAKKGDYMHFHAYELVPHEAQLSLRLADRLSTTAAGVAASLGLQANPHVELASLVAALERKLSDGTLLAL